MINQEAKEENLLNGWHLLAKRNQDMKIDLDGDVYDIIGSQG